MRSNTLLCVAVAVLLNLTGSFGQQDECGQASLNTKIIGGGDAAEGSWPWQVGLSFITSKYIFCGGTLLNKDWVLTSAVCSSAVYEFRSLDTVVYLGRLNQSGPNPHEVNRTVSHVITHPNYSRHTHDNDIALLQLSSPVTFTAYIKPVCLAAAGSEFDQGLPSWLTGWGFTRPASAVLPNTLQETEIPTVSNYNCNLAYNNKSFSITDNMMCAGLSDGGKGSALYDEGGPLVSKQGSRWIQSGIVSMLLFEASDGRLPSVFTRVSKYQDWINTHIVNNQPRFISLLYYNNNILVSDNDTYSISGSSPILHLFPLYFPIFAIFWPWF